MLSVLWLSSAAIAASAQYREGYVLVQFDPSLASTQRYNLIAQNNFKIIRQNQTRQHSFLFKLSADDQVHQVITRLETTPGIKRIQPDYYLRPKMLATIPDDTHFAEQWGLENTGQTINGSVGVVDMDIDAPSAWDLTMGDGSCTMAILDTGVDYEHEDLVGNMWVNPGEIPDDGIDNDNNGYIDDIHGWDFADDDADPQGVNFHGTAVAGLAGAVGNNGKGISGVAPNVRIMALKIFPDDPNDPVLLSDFISALDYAVSNGARVTNMSFSIGNTHIQSFEDAINDAELANHLVVAAAGNNNRDIDITPLYPASYTSTNLISVTGLDNQGGLAADSNFGATSVDLAAPGRFVYTTFPGDRYTINLALTSFAAPMVTGAACIIDMYRPGLNVSQLRSRILDNIKPLASLDGITATGGLLNLYQSMMELPDEIDDCEFFVIKKGVICI